MTAVKSLIPGIPQVNAFGWFGHRSAFS